MATKCKSGTCTGLCTGNCSKYCAWNGAAGNNNGALSDATSTPSGKACSCGTNCAGPCSSCSGTCKGGCSGSSSGSSSSTCGTCGTSCENNCASNCKGSCKSGCTGTCQDTCSGKCTGTCQLECSYGCINATSAATYRKLKLTEYINSSNIMIIITFILNEINRIEGIDNFNYDKELQQIKSYFLKEEQATLDAINYLISILNNVKIDKKHDASLTEAKNLFSLQPISENKLYIDDETGNEIIYCAKVLFNTKKLVYD